MFRHFSHLTTVAFVLAIALGVPPSVAQFKDDFNGKELVRDTRGVNGWTWFTGDGAAVMDFSASGNGYATISVDATKDQRNVWWALIRRRISEGMNLGALNRSNVQFRVEARIKVNDAPKRVNLHLNTQRTTNFHSHLMEFDIPDTSNWHTISMTTRGFDAVQGDSVYGQLALMDWGLENYRVKIDYFKVDIVNVDSVGPDQGVQVQYHPPTRDPATFACHVPIAQNAMVNLEYPQAALGRWHATDDGSKSVVLTVAGSQFVILRWDLARYAGTNITGSGVLELTTHSVQKGVTPQKDFGMLRISEIIRGDPHWNQDAVTAATFCGGLPISRVINSQMIIDVEVNEQQGRKTLATIPQSVLQRLIDGKTLGLAIKPLGAIVATFYANQTNEPSPPIVLHFNCRR